MSKKKDKLIPETARKLYFDIGNSAIKLCYRDNGAWVKPVKFGEDQRRQLMEWLSEVRHQFDYYIVSSVAPDVTKSVLKGMGGGKNLLLHTDHIPENYLNYQSRQTLGIDRFLAGVGGWSVEEGPCVVIDAGTACTVDYVNEAGVYQGGTILPGLSVLERGMQHFTPELPEVERTIPSSWPGKNTRECLQWGITGGFRDAIRGALTRYERSANFSLVITGGDADIVAGLIERKAIVDRTIIFRGMEYFINEIIAPDQSA